MANVGGTTTGQVEGEDDWFFDLIINFIKSPRWKAPMMSFIDEYCIVFDNEDENKFEYTTIHNDFKKLVEDLLYDLMAELEITEEQFYSVCEKAKCSNNIVHTSLITQIMSVDDFSAFRKLMIKRNAELNEEALKIMLKKELHEQMVKENENMVKQIAETSNAKPTATQGEENQKIINELEQEDLNEAIKMSMMIQNQRMQELDEEEEMIRRALELSELEEKSRLEKQKSIEQEQEQQLKDIQAESMKQEELKRLRELEQIELEKKRKKEEEEEIERKRKEQEELLRQQQKQQQPEPIQQEKHEEEKQLTQAQKESKKVGGGYSLPPLSQHKQGEFDNDILREQQKRIFQGFNQIDNEIDMFIGNKHNEEQESKSINELAKEKREKIDQYLEKTKTQQESKEERQARLRAQRDALVKQKQEQRKQELNEFNQKTTKKEDLHKELQEMENNLKQKQMNFMKQKGIEQSQVVLGQNEIVEMSDVDKRLMLYRNMRNKLLQELESNKQVEDKAKMDEINRKIAELEKAQKEKDKLDRQKEKQEQIIENYKMAQNKKLLDNIKSYEVEDI